MVIVRAKQKPGAFREGTTSTLPSKTPRSWSSENVQFVETPPMTWGGGVGRAAAERHAPVGGGAGDLASPAADQG